MDNSGNVYVAGGSDNPNNTDFILIKYNSTIGINPINNEVPGRFQLYQNYPNPFNPETKIKFDVPRTEHVKITVYDITGCKISNIVNQKLTAGSYKVLFSGIHLASGIYFYRLEAADYSQTEKMIIIK